ncbi:MAG: hypothetical protein WAT37_09190, partial [Saprospiraceae bacterium]
MKSILFYSVIIILFSFSCRNSKEGKSTDTFTITIPDSLSEGVSDGRLVLMLSTNPEKEPRFEISDGPKTQQAFGMNLENWKKSEKISFSVDAFGYPITSFSDFPAGEYYLQVLLHKYETFKLSTGKTVKLPMDRGEG